MITNVSIENFKAIHKMETLPMQPFSVFIGNNGSGKSSVLEAIRLIQYSVTSGLNIAFKEWGGLDRVRNYNAGNWDENIVFEPVVITIQVIIADQNFRYQVHFNTNHTGGYIVEKEELVCDEKILLSVMVNSNGITNEGYYYSIIKKGDNPKKTDYSLPSYILLLGLREINPFSFHPSIKLFKEYITNWQFLYLNAHEMGKPILSDRANREIKLDYDGRNIADYLLWLNEQGKEYLDNLISKLQFVLPYLNHLQTNTYDAHNREIELSVYETSENNKKPIPGWLLSSGTLRIVALLAMFVTPKKPSVLFIDEVENGLDPRTIGLLVSLIQEVWAEKSMQVVVTTHSPYFLDLVPLESIIVSEKDNEKTYFHIPKDEAALNIWKDKFSPGKLYTMGKLTK
jgi:predicted ATPase